MIGASVAGASVAGASVAGASVAGASVAGASVAGALVVHSPNASSNSLVFAPNIHVPSGPPVTTALLHPQLPEQSIPHVISLHASNTGFAVATTSTLTFFLQVHPSVEVAKVGTNV